MTDFGIAKGPESKTRHGHAAPVAAVVAVTIAAYATFVAIGLSVDTAPVVDIDRSLILALREPLNPANPIGPRWFEEAAADITALGGFTILTIIASLVVIALVILRQACAAVFLVLSLLGGRLLSSGLKEFFARPRPDLVSHLDQAFTNSFPSGHATVSMVTLLTLAAIASRFASGRGFRTFAVTSAVLISILIGASRVYLGVHWPSDVVAGWALGIGWLGTVWLLANIISRRTSAAPGLGQ
ncbi:MAG: phosphatase PAP2 family protein [Hyphomicrobiales bacterium]|nr:phosphatase PAP2 family protein [Hyphomicrobiales bacterium]